VAVAFLVLTVVNASWLAPNPRGRLKLIAHRGVYQAFDHRGLKNDSCTATRIEPPYHAYLENTLPSLERAKALGAAMVELDVAPTKDGHLVVFHDWTLDCRTEGKGRTRDHAMTDLKQLDVGYGYTADGGKTFPLRGKGIGLMPALDEVLARFPDKRFVINVKSNDLSEGEKLAAYLAKLAPEARARLVVYGGTPPTEHVHEKLPDVAIGSKKSLKSCLLGYMALGWSGYVPAACRKGMMMVPLNIAPWLWGWPHKFQQRMQGAGVDVFVLGPYDGSFGSSGVDDLGQLAELPDSYAGGIWTNRIDRIGPKVRGAAN